MESTEKEQRRDMISRLRRIEGQVRGIQRMVDQEKTCEDIARQLCAARRALDRAFYEVVACSLQNELRQTLKGARAQQAQAAVASTTDILAKYG